MYGIGKDLGIRISALIDELQKIQAKRGDVTVWVGSREFPTKLDKPRFDSKGDPGYSPAGVVLL